jgi:hypothetical protein
MACPSGTCDNTPGRAHSTPLVADSGRPQRPAPPTHQGLRGDTHLTSNQLPVRQVMGEGRGASTAPETPPCTHQHKCTWDCSLAHVPTRLAVHIALLWWLTVQASAEAHTTFHQGLRGDLNASPATSCLFGRSCGGPEHTHGPVNTAMRASSHMHISRVQPGSTRLSPTPSSYLACHAGDSHSVPLTAWGRTVSAGLPAGVTGFVVSTHTCSPPR